MALSVFSVNDYREDEVGRLRTWEEALVLAAGAVRAAGGGILYIPERPASAGVEPVEIQGSQGGGVDPGRLGADPRRPLPEIGRLPTSPVPYELSPGVVIRSEEHTSELQSLAHLV